MYNHSCKSKCSIKIILIIYMKAGYLSIRMLVRPGEGRKELYSYVLHGTCLKETDVCVLVSSEEA